MLSPKPWKFEALARLLLSVFLCVLGGTVLVTVLHYSGPGGFAATRVYLLSGGALGLLAATLLLLNRTWSYEKFFRQVLLLGFCFCTGLALTFWVQQRAGPPPKTSAGELMLIVEPLVLVLFGHFLREHRLSWNEAFGFGNGASRALLFGIVAACLFLPLGWALQWASAQGMLRLHLQPEEQEVVQTLRSSAAWRNQLSLGVVAVFLAPVAEEIFFRGILYPAVKQTGFPRLALWGVAALFALVHFNAVSFIPLLLLAVMLTLLYERTNNLLTSITAHAVFNGVNFAVLYFTEVRSG